MLVVNRRLRIPLREFRFTFARSSGPGGQNVNKSNTKAILRWSVGTSPSLPEAARGRFLERFKRRINAEGVLTITSQRFRDQGRNVADCLEKLRALLEDATRVTAPRRPTRPTRAARARRQVVKRQTSEKKRLRRGPREPFE